MADEQKPVTDAFGVDREPTTGQPIVPVVETKKEPELGEDGKPKVEKKAEVDLKDNPVVKELSDKVAKLETDKGSMGKNLSDARKIIDKAQDEIKRLKEGGKTAVEPLFKDIKRVKDLPKAQQDEMTESEKTLFDSLADTREQMNKLVLDAGSKEAAAQEEAGKQTEAEAETERVNAHITEVVQPIALKYADNDSGIANEIISNFNLFAGNDSADDAELARRMEKAALMTPKYVAAKEQKTISGGKPVEAGTKDDPHGVDAIVEAAGKAGSGKSFSL